MVGRSPFHGALREAARSLPDLDRGDGPRRRAPRSVRQVEDQRTRRRRRQGLAGIRLHDVEPQGPAWPDGGS
jgi:hypothetical protein